jgi:N-acetylmuramoyl-L-alanine amidase
MYPIEYKWLTQNRSGVPLKPIGIVVHSTADPGASADDEFNYFNSGYRGASAHGFIDWNKVIVCIPFSEEAWHAMSEANKRFLGFELCEPSDPSLFPQVWKIGTWFIAGVAKQFGFTVGDIHSHLWVSNTYHQSNHTDPYPFFEKYHKTFDEFLQDVQREMNHMEADAWKQEALDWLKQNKIITSDHNPDEQVTFAQFGVMAKRIVEGIKNGTVNS